MNIGSELPESLELKWGLTGAVPSTRIKTLGHNCQERGTSYCIQSTQTVCTTSIVKYATISEIMLETELQSYTEKSNGNRCEILHVFQVVTMISFKTLYFILI